ncbi:hypothetical protein [Nonomuraea basaltis]|uniref:hypothetical protein n=1 Tax=Nonomuraea basaltis TaxID=2495887 RepID=UPI00110C4A67|nr:hypothetical protein [Nonomuraea basaltis]TMR93283.1 hypothetical protein EJK15_39970 [Nonomuraea basaltis]
MADQEPTTGELSRLIQRVEGRIGDLSLEIRELAAEWRSQIAAGALLSQRVGQLESSQGDQEARLRLVEQDLAGRKESAEKSRRTNMWIATGITICGLIITLVFNLLGK